MANISVKDFKFPRNGNTYLIPQVDDTLSISGAAADAKVTGDEIGALKEDLGVISLVWEQGALSSSDGSAVSSTTRLRTTDYIDQAIAHITCGSGYYVMLFAWNNSTFLGVWNPANNTFVNSLVNSTDIDISLIPNHASYKYKLVLRKTSNGTITTDDATTVLFSPSNGIDVINNDIEGLENSINDSTNKMQGFGVQYLDQAAFTVGGYYLVSNGALTIGSSASYKYQKITGFTEGKYYFKNIQNSFTYLYDGTTYHRLSDITGETGINTSELSVTTDYNFDLYVTCGSADYGCFANAHIPAVPVYGYYVKDNVIVVGSSSAADYGKLKDGIETAIKVKDTTVIVERGEYDLITEFGADYFNGFDANTSESMGIQLGNGVKVVFASDSKVIAHYTGNNTYVPKKFSPFNKMYNGGGFTLENMTLEASNCRYAIHDEDASKSDVYHNVYKNCHVLFDNSGNTNWGAKQCIGGGLGQTGEIEIIGCIFDSVLPSGTTNYGVVSYHNSNNANAKSNIYIRDCYFGDGQTVRASYYGEGTKMTKVVITGCSLGGTPQVLPETQDSATINVEILAYNNEIRTAS